MSINLDSLRALKAPVVTAETAVGIYQARIIAYKVIATEGKSKRLDLTWAFKQGKTLFTETQSIFSFLETLERKSDGVKFAPIAALVLPIRAHTDLPMEAAFDYVDAIKFASEHDITCRAFINDAGYHKFQAVHPIVAEETVVAQSADAAKAAIASLFVEE